MAFKFNCEHCGEELIVYYLKKGDEAQCTACSKQAIVPGAAEYIDVPRPKPIPRPSLLIEQDEERRRERTREEIANYPSVWLVRSMLNVIWYGGIVVLVMTIFVRISCGPDSAFFSTGPYVEIDAGIYWDRPIGLGDGEQVEDLTRPVLIGHERATVRVPGGLSAAPILADSTISMVLALTIIFFLRRLFQAIASGKPFTKENAINVRCVGYLVAAAGPIWGIFKSVQADYFMRQLDIPGARLDSFLSLHPKMIFLGLVIIAIAHLFELAARIQREQDLTI